MPSSLNGRHDADRTTMLNTIGVGLEVVGLAMTLVGAWQTWHRLADPGERPWSAPVRAAVSLARSVWTALGRQVRRLLRRHPEPIVLRPEPIRASIRLSGDLSLSVDYAALPSDTEEALRALDDRTRRTRTDIDAHANSSAREIAGLRQSHEALEERMEREIERVRRTGERTAIEGLKLQFLGFPVVLAGLVLQGIASL